jgi:hypothetical protein
VMREVCSDNPVRRRLIERAGGERIRRLQMNNGVWIVLTCFMSGQPAQFFTIATNRMRYIRYRLLQDNNISVIASAPFSLQFIDADGNRMTIAERK